MTLLTSTVAITIMASESTVVAASSSANDAQQQQLWYPDFASDYESGSCTTSPTPALVAFAAGSAAPTTLAQNDKESCCETWFPDQELCGCLGGCDDENDTAAAASSGVDAAPTQASSSISAEEPTVPDESHKYWYPQFDVTYEQGKCVKAGVNNVEVGPPSYYTKEGGFLHLTLDACCDQWFEHQEGDHCLNALLSNEVVVEDQPMAAAVNNNNMTSSSPTLSAAEKVVVEPVRYQASRSALTTAEESL